MHDLIANSIQVRQANPDDAYTEGSQHVLFLITGTRSDGRAWRASYMAETAEMALDEVSRLSRAEFEGLTKQAAPKAAPALPAIAPGRAFPMAKTPPAGPPSVRPSPDEKSAVAVSDAVTVGPQHGRQKSSSSASMAAAALSELKMWRQPSAGAAPANQASAPPGAAPARPRQRG